MDINKVVIHLKFFFILLFYFIIHMKVVLRSRSLLLFFVKCKQRNISNFHYFESNSWNVTHSMTFATKTCNQYFIVFLDVIQTAIPRYKSCDFLAVFDQLNSHTFTNGGVWLFSFYATINIQFVCSIKISV